MKSEQLFFGNPTCLANIRTLNSVQSVGTDKFEGEPITLNVEWMLGAIRVVTEVAGINKGCLSGQKGSPETTEPTGLACFDKFTTAVRERQQLFPAVISLNIRHDR